MFRVDPRDADAFASGWGAAEIDNGVVFRWMESGRAVLDVDSTTDWRFLRIYCRFADPVRRDVSLAVTDAGDHDYASGLLRWRGPGLRRQTVVLDRPVAAGRRRVVLDASQTWREPGGTRDLSVAVAGLRGAARAGWLRRAGQ